MSLTTRLASLQETIRWCELTGPPIVGFRSEILRPPPALLDEPLGFVLDHGHASVAGAVADICDRRRHELLRLVAPVTTEISGRVLVTTAINESVVDEASKAVSSGWFDSNDLPPWDTWFAYARLNTRRFTEREALFAFVPHAWEARAEKGMKANPVDCIEWAAGEDLRVLDVMLRGVGPA